MNTSRIAGATTPKAANTIGTPGFEVTPQYPYELAVESLSLITGHAANSRKDSRPFSNARGSFLFSRSTLCVFAWPPFSPYSANVFFPFSFFGRNADGSEVTSSFSITNSATFSLGYSALFPATPSGAHESTTTANRTFVFIFLLRFPHWDFLNVFLLNPASASLLPIPAARNRLLEDQLLLSPEFRNTSIPVHSL